jgi:hypothetical protein
MKMIFALLLLTIQFTAFGATYPLTIEPDRFRSGTNDFRWYIGPRFDGIENTGSNIQSGVVMSNGAATLQVTTPNLPGVTRYWITLGVKPSFTSNEFSWLPAMKIKPEENKLVPADRDPKRTLFVCLMLFFIIIAMRSRFGSQPRDRYSTTRLQFEIAAGLYSISWCLPFLVFLYCPDLVYFVLKKEVQWFVSLPFPFVAGLATIFVLPRIKGVVEMDARVQRRLKAVAQIPAQLRWLQSRLSRAEINFDQEALVAALQIKPGQAVDVQNKYGLVPARPLADTWLRSVFLFSKLEKIKTEHEFSSFFDQEATAWTELKSDLQKALSDAEGGQLTTAIQKFSEDVYLFVARLVLFCGLMEKGRLDILRRLGFDTVERTIEGVTFDQMTVVFVVSMTIAVVGLLFPTGSSLESPELKLLKGGMIAVIYTGAVALAVYTCQRTSTTSHRAWFAYLIASLGSVLFAAFAFFTFCVMAFDGDIAAAALSFAVKYPYLISAWTTCFVTCIMLDTKTSGSKNILRFGEAIAGCIIGVAMALLIWYLLGEKRHHLLARHSPVVSLLNVPPLISLSLIFAGLNTSVAALIPHWFRTAAERSRSRNGPATVTTSASLFGEAAGSPTPQV